MTSTMNDLIRAGARPASANPVGRDTPSSVPGTVQGNLTADIAGRAPDEVGTVQLDGQPEPIISANNKVAGDAGPTMNDLLRAAAGGSVTGGNATAAKPRRSDDTAAWRQAITEAVLEQQQADPARAFHSPSNVAEAELRRRYGQPDFGGGTRGRQGQPAPPDANAFVRQSVHVARQRGDI